MPSFFKKTTTPVKSDGKTSTGQIENVKTEVVPVENGPLLQAVLDAIDEYPEPKVYKHYETSKHGKEEEEEEEEEEDNNTDDESQDEQVEVKKIHDSDDEEEVKEKDEKKPKSKLIGDECETHKYFKVFRREIRDLKSGKLVNVETELEIKDTNLLGQITAYGVHIDYEQEKGLFGRVTQRSFVSIERLFIFYEQLIANEYLGLELKKLREWLEPEFERYKRKIEKLISKGKITFDGLWYLFKTDGRFFGRVRGDMVVGAKIVSRRYIGGSVFGCFEITGKSIKSNGVLYFEHNATYTIGGFRGVIDIINLKQQPMSDEMLEVLNARGKVFKQVTLGHHYRQYKGFLIVQQLWGSTLFKADGRVMVDLKTFERMNPSYQEFKNPSGINTLAQLTQNMGYNNNYTKNAPVMAKLHRDLYYMTWPTVAGFSFSCKRWGELRVDQIKLIQFDDHAYDRLVLAANKKDLVQALVDQHHKIKKKKKPAFADLISGKGGGCIFLLHGPPGTGKTLTAEAIAEYLHLPMYSVSVGELGTNTKDLETKLQEILELASIWNAVILMDEADIFLERRSDNDVVRNAMVGIFLRLLEYYEGVLFLTTNRVKVFDEAFHSRISVALRYEELDVNARELVWANFFDASGIQHVNPKDLAQFELNGRQIRNVIQLSRALSQREGTTVDTGHITRTMHVATQFQTELSSEKLQVSDSDMFKIRKHNKDANDKV